ncbi:MAG TPA: exonuclease SbcCD subunit D [Gemmatimonadales bacterium]|nr:exonuclease SbcCD subunit D [Gemmatimonadales bacterium]
MKLAHLADLHLGFRQYHRQTPAGINQREADTGQAFRQAVDGLLEARPDVVVVAGDLFHSVRPTNAAIVFAFRQFQRIRAELPDVPVILIAGNHDTPRSTETGSILRLFDELGVDVATNEARRFAYPHLDLSVLAVPHEALVQPERPALRPDGSTRYEVLVAHGEVDGVFPSDRSTVEYGGAIVRPEEFGPGEWSYVAFGHYHVRTELGPRAWYSGSLEYVSTNPWGELRDEASKGVEGKSWLLADLETGLVTPQPIAPARQVLDLPRLDGTGLDPEALQAAITERVTAVQGGIANNVVRLVVTGVPRHVGRQLDHAAIRAWKAEALHFQLDLRRPEPARIVGVGAPGRRQTLPEIVESYLAARSIPQGMDRAAFVSEGVALVSSAERELVED